jgi:hypothetical protein
MKNFLNKLALWGENFNRNGIPLPTVRDPKTHKGSVSLTLVVLSSALVILGCAAKLLGKEFVDISHSLEFFYASSALYWGRQWQKNDSSSRQSESDEGQGN